MGLAPEGTGASQGRLEVGKRASAARLDESVRIAVKTKEQRPRDIVREHPEHRIPAFSPERPGKPRLR
jgi:hypothetical protein